MWQGGGTLIANRNEMTMDKICFNCMFRFAGAARKTLAPGMVTRVDVCTCQDSKYYKKEIKTFASCDKFTPFGHICMYCAFFKHVNIQSYDDLGSHSDICINPDSRYFNKPITVLSGCDKFTSTSIKQK